MRNMTVAVEDSTLALFDALREKLARKLKCEADDVSDEAVLSHMVNELAPGQARALLSYGEKRSAAKSVKRAAELGQDVSNLAVPTFEKRQSLAPDLTVVGNWDESRPLPACAPGGAAPFVRPGRAA